MLLGSSFVVARRLCTMSSYVSFSSWVDVALAALSAAFSHAPLDLVKSLASRETARLFELLENSQRRRDRADRDPSVIFWIEALG